MVTTAAAGTAAWLEARQAALVAELAAAQAALAAVAIQADIDGELMERNTPASSRARVNVWAIEAQLRDVAAALRRLGAGARGMAETAAATAEAGAI